jgi:MFS family permease
MQAAAIDWHIYLITRSPLALGAVGLTRMVPILVFSLLGGVVADRHDRRRIMLATQTLMLLAAGVLAALTAAGKETLLTLYLLTATSAAASAFDAPARQALIPKLVPRGELPGALALNLTMFHVGVIAGPAVAGLLIAGASGLFTGGPASAAGDTRSLALLYGLNAVSFVGTILALATMRTSGRPDGADANAEVPTLQALREGLGFVFGTPIMVWTMAVDFVATFFSAATSLLPIFADQILHVGPVGYGWLRAAPGFGALAASLVTSVKSLPRRQGPVFLWAVAAFGGATILFGLSRSYLLTFVALFASGFADLISTVVRQTLRQLITPDALRGRMTSVNMIFFLGGPQLGELEAGLVASLFATAAFGAPFAVVSGGVATLLAVAFIAWRAPIVRRYEVDDSDPGS